MRRLLPPRGPLRLYALMTLLDSVGLGLFLTGGVLYFTRVAGLSAVEVGAGMSAAMVVGVAVSIPAGRLGDRYGHRGPLLALNLAKAVLFGAYLFVHSFPAFFAVVCLISLAESASRPLRHAYLARLAAPEERVAARAYNRVMINLGASAGTLVAGLALAVDTPAAYRLLVAGNAVSFLLVAGVLPRLPRFDPIPAEGRRGVLADRRYLLMAVLCGLMLVHADLLEVALPLWVVSHTEAPGWVVSALFLCNTVLAILFQVRASRGVETTGAGARAVRRSGLAVLAGCLVLATTGALPPVPATAVLLGGVALVTAAELLSSAGGWAISYGLAPEGRQGEYQGAWTLGSQLARACGPVAITASFTAFGAGAWLVLGGFFAVIATLVVPALRVAGPRPAPVSP
ncbi:MFS transporter [Bailinhaonella thermotolerans]|uniref:MFS transporter n=1 Tax=Bailinhaonella thermotolerans TaxID=1070861 RepID=A0A3A4AKF9_9ACTN|nr:MFS transporter [Bailinhaonella thermotolerans]RJL30136.1 MFS transporter [Bailinhaonella thermotolerans]